VPQAAVDGLLVVDKEVGWTSHDVVARCRKLFGQRRVGHAGTLDPDATGVLLVGLGRVTRLLRFLTPLPKSYVGEVVLGTATSTLDASGDVTGEWDMSAVGLADVRAAAAAFVGEIDQVPPMVSAVHVGGRRLHELAREGIEVEREARRVTVHRLDVDATPDASVYRIDVTCSSGTYVRSLAADIGAALGGGGHLRRLRRTAIGSFAEAAAVTVSSAGEDDVISPADALRDYDAFTVDAPAAIAVSHGKVLDAALLDVAGEGPWRVLDPSGRLLAVYERHQAGTVKPAVVLS
jgi:tRNA pseudouridine55 synthase